MAGVHVAILAFVGVIAAFDPRSGDMASISSIRKYSLGEVTRHISAIGYATEKLLNRLTDDPAILRLFLLGVVILPSLRRTHLPPKDSRRAHENALERHARKKALLDERSPAGRVQRPPPTTKEMESVMKRMIRKDQTFTDFLFGTADEHDTLFARGYTGKSVGGHEGLDGLLEMWENAGGHLSHPENLNFEFYAMVERMQHMISEGRTFLSFMTQWSSEDVVSVKDQPGILSLFENFHFLTSDDENIAVGGWRLAKSVTGGCIEVQTWRRLGGRFTTLERRMLRGNNEWLPGHPRRLNRPRKGSVISGFLCKSVHPIFQGCGCRKARKSDAEVTERESKSPSGVNQLSSSEIRKAVEAGKSISEILGDTCFDHLSGSDLPDVWTTWQRFKGPLTAVENLNLEFDVMTTWIGEFIGANRSFTDFMRRWSPADVTNDGKRLFSKRVTRSCIEVETWHRMGGSLSPREEADIECHTDYLELATH
ncbi:hypothetical protein AAMO2058_001226800 [Amorphochlora amoebiformis]